MKNKYILLALLSLPVIVFAQTAEERAKIATFSDKEANEKLLQELQQEDAQRKARLAQYFAANPNARKIIKNDDTGKVEIMDVLPNGEFILAKTDNSGAAITARANKLYNGGGMGLNIQGQGMTAAIWDGGTVRDTHQEFMVGGVSKVTIMDGGTWDQHPTHVGGTIAAQGVLSTVRGLAFNSNLFSYDWSSDITEMTAAAAGGLLVSNHSYGMGSLSSIWFYGAYDSRARQIDGLCFNNPFYLPVFSAGNSRNETTAPGSTQIANKFGYDLIYGHGNAKNVMTVAAVNNVSSYTGPSSVVMSSFSSWGPSDDGRIKPDISMKGVNVRSTLSTSDTATGFMSGTSMAAPGVTGVVTLLQQYHNQLYSNYMRAATVKGLILHTADEAGNYEGPDYEFGWGLINAEKAATTIRDKNLTTNRSIVEENVLFTEGSYTKYISAAGTEPLKVSISWTDPASNNINSGTIDPSSKYLINDLDVKVTSASGTIYYPWSGPGMAIPYNPSTNNSTNNVDNFERVDIPNPSGNYTITVTHKGTLTNSQQNYTLIVTGANLSVLGVDEIAHSKDQLIIYPNPSSDFVNIKNFVKGSKVSILDMEGSILKQEKSENGKIDISKLSTGNYLLVYVGKDGVEKSFKFIKK